MRRVAIRDRGVLARERWHVIFKRPRNRHWYHFTTWRLLRDAAAEAEWLARRHGLRVERLGVGED